MADTLISEQDLVKKAAAKDPVAQKLLYLKYSRPLFNAAMRILCNRPEAEDVLQESYLSAFANLAQLKDEKAFYAWIKNILINRSIDLLRKRSYHIISAGLEKVSETQEPDEDREVSFSVDEIRSALASLPDGYRMILSLYLFEDFSHKQIAEKLSISEGTSKSQYARGRKKLAELLRNKASEK